MSGCCVTAFTGAFSGRKSSNRYGAHFEPQRRRVAENFLFDRGWLNKSETIARGVLRPRDPSKDYGKFLLKEHDQAAPHGQSR